MAVVSIKKEWAESAKFTMKQTDMNRRWVAICDEPSDEALLIYSHKDCPRVGHQYTYGDPVETHWARISEINIERASGVGSREGGYKWEITGLYTTATEEDQDPLKRPWEIEWGGAHYQKPCVNDKYGGNIVNSAGFPFDPPAEMDDSRPVLKITRNEAEYSETFAAAYQDAINTNAWNGGTARQWKVADITAKRKREQGIFFWEVSYEFHFRRETWKKKLLDAGLYDALGKPIKDAQNQPVTDAVPLDGAGFRALPGSQTYRQFDVYEEADFDALNLSLV